MQKITNAGLFLRVQTMSFINKLLKYHSTNNKKKMLKRREEWDIYLTHLCNWDLSTPVGWIGGALFPSF